MIFVHQIKNTFLDNKHIEKRTKSELGGLAASKTSLQYRAAAPPEHAAIPGAAPPEQVIEVN